MERLRLFIAVDVGGDVPHRYESVIGNLKWLGNSSRIKWIDPGNLHLTLKFLGSTPVEALPVLETILKDIAANHRAFFITLAGLGMFSTRQRTQVLWADVQEGKTELERIAAELDQSLGELGIPREPRAFAAHLTLGRAKDRSFTREALNKLKGFPFGTTPISELVLFESQTLPAGAVYRALVRARLA
ncbi:MAG: RNA 2',3'-cyclic phosphodiesterase [Oligoflexia bacterium]|nr:RNA 2',3'-cyclic phosphodiesterase [Oligoflexia bacterium]